jgi:WD40 repeat protein
MRKGVPRYRFQRFYMHGMDWWRWSTTCSYCSLNTPDHSNFVTGCNNGSTKLWSLNGVCKAEYKKEDRQENRVASISAAVVDKRQVFVCGHENGVCRLWDTWSGTCLGEFIGHKKRVTSIKFVLGEQQFVSASTDATMKLWDTRQHYQHQEGEQEDDSHTNTTTDRDSSQQISENSLLDYRENGAVRLFQGHTGAILSIALVDDKTAILSGSRDGTARLWSLSSGQCLRVFSGACR